MVDSLIGVAFTLPPNPSNPYGLRWVWAALEFKAHGYLEAYQNAIERAVEWFQSRPPDQASPFNLARSLYHAERFADAYLIFDSLVTADPDNVTLIGFLGTTAAHLGRRDEAMAIDRRLENTDQPYLEGEHTRWRASIAAVLGDSEAAVRLLHRALREGRAYGVWMHRAPDFESLRDYPPFQELMRPKG
jgi:tetratricopeptide (TPR) repeat protein